MDRNSYSNMASKEELFTCTGTSNSSQESPLPNSLGRKLMSGLEFLLIMVIRIAATVVLQVWMITETILSAISGPVNYIYTLLTNPHGVAMFWIIVEVFFEMGISVVLAGVSILMSAILLLEDAFSEHEEGKGDDNSSKGILKKVRAKLPCSQRPMPRS